METINKGRNNQMPAHKSILTPGKIHLLAAYVWSLSNTGNAVNVSDADTKAIKQISATAAASDATNVVK